MKRGIAAALACLLISAVAVLAQPADSSGWVTSRFGDTKHSFDMPGTPIEESKETDTPAGKVKLTRYSFQGAEGKSLFIALRAEVLPGSPEMSQEERLDKFREMDVEGRTLLSQRKISIDGNPGREMLVDNDGGDTHIRNCLIGDTLYELLVISTDDSPLTLAEKKRFLNSFKAVANKPGQWQIVRVPELGFQIEMPGEPVKKVTPGKFTTYGVSLENDKVSFSLNCHQEKGSYEDRAAEVLAATRESVVKAIDGRLIDESEITLDKHPGQHILIKYADGFYHQRLILVGSRMYQALVVVEKGATTKPAEIERFFDSLKLIDSATPSTPSGGAIDPVAFVEAVRARDPRPLVAHFHPSLLDQIDPPVLQLIFHALQSQLGAAAKAEASEFKPIEGDLNGSPAVTYKGFVKFARGRTPLDVTIQNGKIAGFNLSLDPLEQPDTAIYTLLTEDQQLARTVADYYAKSGSAFLRLVLAGKDKQAYDALSQLFQSQFTFEQVQPEFEKSRAAVGELKEIEMQTLRVEGPIGKPDRFMIGFKLQTEMGEADGRLTYQFAGYKSALVGFSVTRDVPLDKDGQKPETKPRKSKPGVVPPPGAPAPPAPPTDDDVPAPPKSSKVPPPPSID